MASNLFIAFPILVLIIHRTITFKKHVKNASYVTYPKQIVKSELSFLFLNPEELSSVGRDSIEMRIPGFTKYSSSEICEIKNISYESNKY